MLLIQVLKSWCGGCSPVARESLHPDGRVHQVDVERRGGDWRGFVAGECFWALSFPLQDSHWKRLKCL